MILESRSFNISLMDPWLTDEVKELIYQPCLDVAGVVGRRLDNRLRMRQSIDERALTEGLVEHLDVASGLSLWNKVQGLLNDKNIYVDTSVRKPAKEYENGADLGITISRNVHNRNSMSTSQHACLVQCKKVTSKGIVDDFFHEVKSSGKKQSSLLLDITPSAFYFVFTPPSLVQTYSALEPIAFLQARPDCNSPILNMGHFGYEGPLLPLNSQHEKANAVGILVVPALAVEAQFTMRRSARLEEILPNCIPFWYWFTELFLPGFVGDRSQDALSVASNGEYGFPSDDADLGANRSLNIRIGSEGIE